MQARLFFSGNRRIGGTTRVLFWRPEWVSVLALALLVAAQARPAVAAPSANPVEGEFDGEHEYTGKDGESHEIQEPPKQDRSVMSNMLRTGKANTDAERLVFERFSQYHTHALTWRENIDQLPALRTNLKKQLTVLGRAGAPDLHGELNRLVLKVCSEAVGDERYPLAIRFNCLQMIGELDSKELGPANKTAVPLAEALEPLMTVATDAAQHPALRITALVYLRRHVLAGMPQAEQNSLAEAMMKIVETPPDPQRDNSGTLWLRLRAIDMLHQLSLKGLKIEQQAIAAALSPMIADQAIATWMRCQAVGEFAGVESQQIPAKQVAQDVRAVASLVIAITEANAFTKFAHQAALEKEAAEKAEAEEQNPRRRRSAAADKDDEADGEKSDKPAEARPLPLTKEMRDTAIRELQHGLALVRKGLLGKEAKRGEPQQSETHGLYAAADDATRKLISALVTFIDDVQSELSKLEQKREVLKDDIAKVANVIEGFGRELLDQIPAEVEEPEPAGEPEKAVSGQPRTGPPAGNAPAGTSATGR